MKDFKITGLQGAGGGGGGANSYLIEKKNILLEAINASTKLNIPTNGNIIHNVRFELMGPGGGGSGGRMEKDKFSRMSSSSFQFKVLNGMNNFRVEITGPGGGGGDRNVVQSGNNLTVLTGGGGGGGPYLKTNLQNLPVNSTLSATSRYCGIGQGGSSCPITLTITNAQGATIDGYKLNAGGAGTTAYSSYGKGGSGGNSCQRYTSGSWKTISCTKNGSGGYAGYRKQSTIRACNLVADGGKGGYSGNGVTDDYGQDGQGGKGVGVGYSSFSNNRCGYGQVISLSGGSAKLILRYDQTINGAGGGGGAKYHGTIPNNLIVPGGRLDLVFHNPGKGGAAGANGTDAGNLSGGARGNQIQVYNPSKPGEFYGYSAWGGSGASSTGGIGGNCSQKDYGKSWYNVTCTANGENGANTGAGGRGGSTSTTLGKGGDGGITGSGSDGQVGYAKIYYDQKIPSPISGGGGGSGAVISNKVIPQSIIDSNIGGKIEIKSGAGGAYGAARANGSAGGESYVVVKNTAGKIVWGYKTLGGQGGGAASTSSGGSGGNGGTCQSWNGSAWIAASCSSNGIKGSNGAKSSDGSAVSGGRGASSGVGAGGAGAANISSNGANGIAGKAGLTYDRYFQAAAGGGGGGGGYAQINNIKVIPLKTYTVTIGKGGSGGAVGANGQNGGISRLIIDGKTYSISGGEGGKAGKGASLTTALSQGAGGNGAQANITSAAVYKNGSAGSNAASSGFNSTGGNGGQSGITTKGACGGLFMNVNICQNSSIHASILSFKLPRNLHKTPSLGSAGAGGGGGGWNSNNYNQTGKGSAGLDGYVYVR